MIEVINPAGFENFFRDVAHLVAAGYAYLRGRRSHRRT
jgi:hypothetical protein